MPVSIINVVVLLGVLAAVVALIYFLFRELQDDHETGEYHFTWAVGIVALFLMGFGPGLVGLGLYLTIERGYPLYWLVVGLLVAFLIVAILGFGLYAGTSTVVVEEVAFGG